MKQETAQKLAAALAAQTAAAAPKTKTTRSKKAAQVQPPAAPSQPAQVATARPADAGIEVENTSKILPAAPVAAPAAVEAQDPQIFAPAAPDAEAVPAVKKSPLKSFTFIWHEGSARFDGKTATSWAEANRMLATIYREHGNSLGYTKCKVHVAWENGREFTDRIDVGNAAGDYNCSESIGTYLQRQKNVMYHSNLMQGDRDTLLSFEDEKPHVVTNISGACLPASLTLPAKVAIATQAVHLVRYSEKAVAVYGDTKPLKDELKKLGGKFNNFLKINGTQMPGWIFPLFKQKEIRATLKLA